MTFPRFTARLFAIALIVHTAVQAQEMQDVVYLKNGSIIRGMIIEQVPGKSLKIQTKDGSVFVYEMSDVERMTKETSTATTMGPVAGGFAVSGHIGTDIEGGLGFGGGFAYVLSPGGASYAYEFSLDYFYHGYKETEGGNTEEVDLSVFAVRANWLWNYAPGRSGVYFVTGVGFVIASLNWQNHYDPAVYGYSLTEDETYSSAGNVFNLGMGWTSAAGIGMRLETPMLFFYGAGNTSAFVPTFTLGIKYFIH